MIKNQTIIEKSDNNNPYNQDQEKHPNLPKLQQKKEIS